MIQIKPAGRIVWSRTPQVERAQFKSKIELSIAKPIVFDLRPRLCRPLPLPKGSFQPPRYFSRGVEPRVTPIRDLLTESLEVETPRPVPNSASLIRSLCKGKGHLLRSDDGMIFLNIDNKFIESLMPHLRAHGLIRPPYFGLAGALQGAHIPVVSKREANFNYLYLFRELGLECTFEVEGLYSIAPDSWPELEEIWFLKVTSKDLETLRKKYFLSSAPNGHSFHIVVAVKPRPKKKLLRKPNPFLRINPACHAV